MGLIWVMELEKYGKWRHSIVGRGERLKMSLQWEAPEVLNNISVDFTVGVSRSHCSCGDNECYINGENTGRSDEELRHENIDIGNSDLYKGKVFNSDDEAYNCYVNFAKQIGFSTRRDRYFGSAERPTGIYRRDYVCHRARSPRPQKVVEKERQRDRKSSRCNCNAKMCVAKEIINGVTCWIVVYFDNVHNHELLNHKEVKFLPAYRNIDIIDQKRILLLAKAGCSMSLIRRVLELEKGVDVGQLFFTKKDIRKFVQSQSSTNIEYDALELLKICKSLKDKDVDFQYDFTVDACQRLENIIWTFGDSIRAYEIFGNVSFLWLMNGKHPQTILTDQDLGLIEAIKLPLTKHAFCIWHITSKFSTWFSFVLGSRYLQFKYEFRRLYEIGSIEEFECQWKKLITKFDLESDSHIKLLYVNRASWALPYLKGYFFAGMTTTGRSESINAYLKRFLHARTSLKEFVEQKHASKVLTPFSFKLLQDEMILSVEYGLFSNSDGSYIVRHYDKTDGGRFVYWNPLEETFYLSTNAHNYFMLPEKYLLAGWRQENVLVLKFSHMMNPNNDDNEFQSLQSIVRDLTRESMKTKVVLIVPKGN
ncbi:protein FAR1-RELATED SEQUENCE 11-like [Nicotiana sylvestris]|uniref:protein FAR1-RELATED SEQUENCE 11-like n=1 Tax=Nicotiana sylvestris TaxID=4096 RepID=UPI00388C6F36